MDGLTYLIVGILSCCMCIANYHVVILVLNENFIDLLLAHITVHTSREHLHLYVHIHLN